MEKHQKVTVAGILVQNDKMLVCRRSLKEKFYPGIYEFPGGKVEFGENPEIAIKREFLEETGLEIEVLHPVRVIDWISPEINRHSVEIVFMLKLANENQQITLSSGHDDYRWVNYEELEKLNTTEEILKSANLINKFSKGE